MGASSSVSAPSSADAPIFASARTQSAFEKIASATSVAFEDAAYDTVLSSPTPLPQLAQPHVDRLTRDYGEALAQNNLRSGNYRVLLHYVLHLLPRSGQAANPVSPMNETHATTHTVRVADMHRAVNALFLVRQFTMRFVETSDEMALLAHFEESSVASVETPARRENDVSSPDVDGDSSIPRVRRRTPERLYIQMEPSDATESSTRTIERGTSPPKLATRFLNALLTTLVECPPTEQTYDLHVEVVNTLLVLVSPVVYPRDPSKPARDVVSHNPFLYMLMASSSYAAHAIVYRLLQNYSEQLQATGPSALSNTTVVALEKAREMSLVNMSKRSDQEDEHDQFSYLTLEGVGSIAASIFRFPWTFIQYLTTRELSASPLADRSVLLLLVLLQSGRDRDSMTTSNPFRDAFCRIRDSEVDFDVETEDTRVHSMQRAELLSSSSCNEWKISYSNLFQVIGSHASYETSHLMLYTLMYSNPMMAEAAMSDENSERLVLPLLETLYHLRSVEPTRLYMLVIVVLTLTQDVSFVRMAHTRFLLPSVPWYHEHYMPNASLGSLLLIILTRLIFRNITRFQDSFLHLNAFAALSNLARFAENLHVVAAQGMVGLIEILAKKESKLVTQMKGSKTTMEEADVVAQQRSAYVEFIRLLLGVLSSCLKTELLPRNPQLIYALVHRRETFDALQQHSEFSEHVHNGPVWRTLARFHALVEAKTSLHDTVDAEMVLEIIQGECRSLLAASSARTNARAQSSIEEDQDATYRYEEEADPEQFFIPYIWKLIQEQTPDFCWKSDKITLFVPSGNRAPMSVVVD